MNKSNVLTGTRLSIILRVLFSLFLLALLLWLTRESFAKIWHLLSCVHIPTFALAFMLFILSVMTIAIRLGIVLRTQAKTFSLNDLFSLSLIGYFFTNFMPTSVGGDLVKGYYISKKTENKLGSYSSVFVDRIIGMFSVALIASVTLVIMRKNIENKLIIWGIALLLFCCLALVFSIFQKGMTKKIGKGMRITYLMRALRLEQPIKKVYGTLRIYADHKEIIFKALLTSIVAQLITFLSVFVLSKSLGVYIPLGKVFLVMPVVFILCMLPITVNGLGLREWAFVFFFSSNIGEAAALSLSLLYLAMFLLISLIGGIIYLFWR